MVEGTGGRLVDKQGLALCQGFNGILDVKIGSGGNHQRIQDGDRFVGGLKQRQFQTSGKLLTTGLLFLGAPQADHLPQSEPAQDLGERYPVTLSRCGEYSSS